MSYEDRGPPPRAVRVNLDDGRVMKVTPDLVSIENPGGRKLLTIPLSADQAQAVTDALAAYADYDERRLAAWKARHRTPLTGADLLRQCADLIEPHVSTLALDDPYRSALANLARAASRHKTGRTPR